MHYARLEMRDVLLEMLCTMHAHHPMNWLVISEDCRSALLELIRYAVGDVLANI